MLYLVIHAEAGVHPGDRYPSTVKRKADWHTGEPKFGWEGKVECIQADGDELQHIVRHITGIHMANKAVVVWRGDDAQFIYDNLLYEFKS